MSNKSAVYSVLSFSFSVAAVCGVFMTFSKASGCDDALSFRVVSWMFVCCLAAFLVFTFAFKEKFSKKTNFKSKGYIFTCALGVFLSGGLSVYGLTVLVCSLIGRLGKSAVVYDPNALIPAPSGGGGVYLPNVLFTAALAGTAVYFSFCIFSRKEKKSTLFAALSLFPSLALAVKLISDFLAQNINGYSKLYNFHLLSLAFFLLFFVNESRIYLRKSAAALYVFFGVAGSMAALVYGVPSFAFSCRLVKCANRAAASARPVYLFADLLTLLYVYIRLFSLGFREREKLSGDHSRGGTGRGETDHRAILETDHRAIFGENKPK